MARAYTYLIICHLVLMLTAGDLFRPVECSNIQLDLTTLNGYQWSVSLPNGSLTVPATVPGGIYTDLGRGGVLTEGPFLYRFNDVNYRWVALHDWDYQLTFNMEAAVVSQPGVFLILHGVDTVAEINLNGITLSLSDNMFHRYRFNVRNLLKAGENRLRVRCRSAITHSRAEYEQQLSDYVVPPKCVPPEYQGECHANFIRKMQASFGWDWGPAFPSVGLWKAVSIEAYPSLTLRDVFVDTRYDGVGGWQLNVKLYCETADVGAILHGTWTIQLSDYRGVLIEEWRRESAVSGNLDREATIEFQFKVSNEVEPWMPNGYGGQSLYRLSFSYSENATSNGSTTALTKEIRIGFRTVALVENDLDTGGRTFYVTVNGVAIFLKGSNWIPADILPELVTVDYVQALLTDCKDANMNSLRVWGGGLYEMDEFYQMADELGILIWQDFMFACSMYPTNTEFLESVSVEVRQQVRRLQHHPSLLIWAGNNENEAALRGNWYNTFGNFETYRADYVRLYVDTIRTIVSEEDPSRPFVVSSPSNGKESEEEGHIAKDPYSQLYGDSHYYNYYANGWNASSYPRPRMSTEYGFQSLPSAHAWAEVADPLDQEDWSYGGPLLSHRQHHPLGNFEMQLQVTSRLGQPRRTSSRREFLDMIYLTQMHQAQAIKTETEHYRRHRYELAPDGTGLTMAALYWQLNDIWAAPSWASIEHGGRWKPLHYFAVDFFAPLLFLFSELQDGSVAVFAHFDRREDLVDGTLKVSIRAWNRIDPVITIDVPVKSQEVIAGQPVWSRPLQEVLAATQCTRETCFITSSFVPTSAVLPASPDNYIYLTSFPNVASLQKANVEIVDVSDVYVSERSPWTVNITLATDAIAAFTWLDTLTGRAGTFSSNGFLLHDRFKRVSFYSKGPLTDPNEFFDELMVTHLADVIM